MKNMFIITLCLTIIAAIASFYTAARAQDGRGPSYSFNFPGPQHHRGDGPPPEHFMARMTQQLGLSEDQQHQMSTIMEAERANLEPLLLQLEQSRAQLQAATAGGRFDEAQVRALAQQQAAIHVEMMVSRERAKAKIYNLLTPEQRAQADQMMERWHHRRQQR